MSTIIAIFTISFNVQAVGEAILQDPEVTAQAEINKTKVIIEFKEPRNLKTIINLVQKSSTNQPAQLFAYYQIELEKVNLEIPAQLSTSDKYEIQISNISSSKSSFLSNLSQAKAINQKDIITLGENKIDLAELNSKVSLDELNKKSEEKEINPKITKISFDLNTLTDVLKNLQTKENNKGSDKKGLKEKKVQTNTLNTDTVVQIQSSDILSLQQKSPTYEEKKQILDQAKETKKQIAQQKIDAQETAKAKLEKDRRLAQTKQDRKAKKKEIQDKINQGKGDQVSLDDVYSLGDEGKDFGIEILPPEKEGDSPRIKQDNNKIRNFKEEKTLSQSIVDTFSSLLGFSSINAEAFDYETNTNIFHATPNTHKGTALDLFSGYMNNGARIGVWSKHDGWNQKFTLYQDGQITVGGKCIDLNNFGMFNGGKIQLWDCNGGPAQKWVYDTANRLRLKANPYFCIDNDYGNLGTGLYLWQCTGNTERFRHSYFEMRLYSRPSSLPGHTFVQIARFDDWNNVSANTTYSMWPSWTGNDNENQNTNFQYKEANDRYKQPGWDDRWVNHNSELPQGYNATQFANYANGLGYWAKVLPQWRYDQIVNGGYLIPIFVYVGQGDCVTYSVYLWHNYGGLYIPPGFGNGNWVVPGILANTLYNDQVYY